MNTPDIAGGIAGDIVALLEAATLALARFRHQLPQSIQDELRQEAVTRALGQPELVDPPAFVHRVARHLAIDCLRRKSLLEWSEGSEWSAESPWDRVEAMLDLERVQGALAEAPLPYQEIVRALVFEGQTPEALALAELCARGEDRGDEAAYARARDAVYKRRTRALGWLRRKLGDPL